jgi:preprotein translocase subunit SecF
VLHSSRRIILWVSVSAALTLGAVATVTGQEIYRSVDAQGHVVYSDRGANKNAPKTSLQVDQGNADEAARLAHEQEQLHAQDVLRSKQQAVDDKAKAAVDHKRDSECKSARAEYYRMMDTRRLAQPQRDADGNRVYYSDDEADAMREKAKKAMQSACPS